MAGKPAPVEISDAEALAVIGCILLALKHPENTGPASKLAWDCARRLAIALVDRGVPLPSELLDEWERDLGVRAAGSRG